MTEPLRFLLAFDHRASLFRSFFGVEGEPSPADRERARVLKEVIWDGLATVLADGRVSSASAGVLVDDTFGRTVLDAARARGVATAVPLEASGKDELEFETADWRERIAELDPTWAKVLVRYHPLGDLDGNARQRTKLVEVSEHARQTGRGFMLELLVPPPPTQADDLDRDRFDRSIRPGLTVRAIEELSAAGVEPDLWKLEGFDERRSCEAVAAAAIANGRDGVGCLVLGRGADRGTVDRWLEAAAGVPGFVGFAIGRSIWWQALKEFFAAGAGEAARSAAAETVAREYTRFVDVFERSLSP